MGRLIFFGIDGLSHSMWRELADIGTMPCSAELFADSTVLPMLSSVPEVSSVAWTSIVTGTDPGEHNIFGFTDIPDGTYTLAFTSSRTVKATPFWQLRQAGRSLVINMPQTYPAQPLDGILVAGYVALDLGKAVYPNETLPMLQSAAYEIDVDMATARTSEVQFHGELLRVLRARASVLDGLWETDAWDTIAFVVTGTDRLNHYYWHRYEGPAGSERDRFLAFYSAVDETLGKVVDRLNRDDHLVIVSDHGFERQDWSVNVNRILREAGLLELADGEPITPASILPETRAFALDPGRIYVHRDGRYPHGSVAEGDVEGVLAEVQELFAAYEVSGQAITESALLGTDLYTGPWAFRSPDLVLMPAPHVAFSARLQGETVVEESQIRGKHTREDAVFLYHGPAEIAVPDQMTVADLLPALQRCGALASGVM